MLLTPLALAFAPSLPPQDFSEEAPLLGHSAHGAAFDEGPRSRPWLQEGIGTSHFPITTSVPEVQQWFDQGHTLLHSFWFFEAERAFRWCIKLDPDCAMAYWGLARATGRRGNNDRIEPFLAEAIARKANVTDRERMYIEAWEEAFVPELSGAVEVLDEGGRDKFEALANELEKIVIAYPDDLEARALHGLYALYSGSRYGLELIFQEIIAKQPLHPGAHHYRIHNWDGPEGAYALSSCAIYGELAEKIGHANHMPGHIYSGIGMWHEAAIWMDSATRVEKAYMQRELVLPFNNWNYAHNRNYLSFIQEQLGMAAASLDGAEQLLAAPLDPKYNVADGAGHSVYRQGLRAMVRGLIKFERWDAILEEGRIPWRDGNDEDRLWRPYAEGLAHLAQGDLKLAIDLLIELKKLEDDMRGGNRQYHELLYGELRARVALAQGEELEGMQRLAAVAQEQAEFYEDANDPPMVPHLVHNVLGEEYMRLGSATLAVRAFEAALDTVPNDGFALSGLARAQVMNGNTDAATMAYGRLLFVWSDADPNLRWMESARALGLDAKPIDESAAKQRNYRQQTLDALGPNRWEPYAAPELNALGTDGETVTLADYAGKNVVLVFFLGAECPHCVDQLMAIDDRFGDFSSRNTEVLAISSDTPADNLNATEIGDLQFRLLSDAELANAKRYRSYDDFEEIELHSTILIDGEGKVRWVRSGGDPFMDLDFLIGEIDRLPDVSVASEGTGSDMEGGQ
jgi:peroxiredoxin